MKRLLGRLTIAITGPHRRRRRLAVPGLCEMVEVRVVLSAVAPVSSFPGATADVSSGNPNRAQDEGHSDGHSQSDSGDRSTTTGTRPEAGTSNDAVPSRELSASRSVTRVHSNPATRSDRPSAFPAVRNSSPSMDASANIVRTDSVVALTASDKTALQPPEPVQSPLPPAQRSEDIAEQSVEPAAEIVTTTSQNRVPPPTESGESSLSRPAAVLTSAGRTAAAGLPAGQSADVTSDDTNTFEDVLATGQVVRSGAGLPAEWNLPDEAAVDVLWRSGFDGFIEISRPTPGTEIPAADSTTPPRQTAPDAEIMAVEDQRHRVTNGDRSNAVQETAGDDVVGAAAAFFHRQMTGGFVDSSMDELKEPTVVRAAIATPGNSGLEGSIGRLNPFDDGRDAALLMSMSQQTHGDFPASRSIDGATTADLALAGLTFGIVGVRSRMFSRLWQAVQRRLNRLRVLLAGTYT